VVAELGQRVRAGQKLLVLDAMKTEMVIAAPAGGVVRELLCKAGQMVSAGQQLAILDTA
jgi:biotin carboxyl carrier protein